MNTRVSKVRGHMYEEFRCDFGRHREIFADEWDHHLCHLNEFFA